MSEFKVGDRVRIKKNDIVGCIYEVTLLENREFGLDVTYYDMKYSVTNENMVYVNLKEEDLELIEKAKEPPTLEDLEQRIKKLEKCVMGEQKGLFSEVDIDCIKAISRNSDYKYVCRESDDSFHFFIEKPTIYNIEELLKGECEE